MARTEGIETGIQNNRPTEAGLPTHADSLLAYTDHLLNLLNDDEANSAGDDASAEQEADARERRLS
ncbi:hypothetical protein CAI21_17870 [Alkalilimnicola ehrlichii]|uniref:Uncharacterized protein n=1 Tax=Alkalilimnicola ehrlichii TaxID=351052 RepID=A0A3E0WL38_9GAMM|nr:hypothetical protein [Alkalilimnicola ehrlichii]RFA25828.1 hypothetical protein CAI21_17870 [Alkalilimnicola ehrlichii]RFA33119.1 hypothetical protein CAL65_18315 [Alkalilimnicola ehrlichii]